MPKSSEREYRSMAIMRAVRSEEGAEAPSFIVEGYATTFSDPYLLYEYGDEKLFEQVDPHAFDNCDMTDVIMQFDHAGMVYARTRNNTLELKVDEHGLFIRADLSSTQASRELYAAINTGLVDRMSFGFTIVEDAYNQDTSTDTILQIGKLFDVSAVSIPANPGTEISTARKALLDGEIEKLRTERSAKEREALRRRALKLKIRLMEGEENA